MILDHLIILEITATILGLIYLILLINENIWCWIFGGVSSLLSVILFYYTQLYSEAILYIFYVVMAGYGYIIWQKGEGEKELSISNFKSFKKGMTVLSGILLGILMGLIMDKNTNADLPYVDAQTTAFSFIATFLEAHKILFGWIIWIVVNGVTIALYGYKELYFYSGLMVVYFFLSCYGYYNWNKRMISV